MNGGAEINTSGRHVLVNVNILEEIRFAYLPGFRVAGMAEPHGAKLDETLNRLREAGVGAVATLTEDNPYGDRFKSAGFLHIHAPIDDCEAPTADVMDRIIEFIEDALQEGRGVVVHCLEGRGRTGTALAAWLALELGVSGEEAIDKIYEMRFHTVITPPQRTFIIDYIAQKS